jgi:hypothetical protein
VTVGDGPVQCPRHVEADGRQTGRAEATKTRVVAAAVQNSEVVCVTAVLGAQNDLGRQV